eukprot:scaffold3987_cov249-Prasinococcus_capsulatus_cf.AAC.2
MRCSSSTKATKNPRAPHAARPLLRHPRAGGWAATTTQSPVPPAPPARRAPDWRKPARALRAAPAAPPQTARALADGARHGAHEHNKRTAGGYSA